MKKLMLCALMLAALACWAEEPKETVAVPMFGGTDTETCKVISDLFSTKLASKGLFRVLTRTNIDAIAKEADYQLSGNTSDEDAVALGKQLNAKYIVAGQLTTLGTLKVLYVQLLNVETAEVISGSEKKFTEIEEAYDYVDDLVGIMVSKLTGEKYETTDEKKFDRNKLLAQYRFSRNMMIGSRVTWISAIAVAGVSGMILTDRGTRPASEFLSDPLFAVPAASSMIAGAAIVSDIVFTLRTGALKKEMDSRGIKYAIAPALVPVGDASSDAGFRLAPSIKFGLSY